MQREYNKHPAKVTPYNGVTYKSVTEARWAQTFDFLGWEHVYEASMLDGWNPDFMLTRSNGGRVWVEVKPDAGPFWAAAQRKMQNARLDRTKDVLAFVYRHLEWETEPVLFGRIGVFDTLTGENWGWTWWDSIVWWADDPVCKWGLAIPHLSCELLLSEDEVAVAGGIVV